jgi:pterin-4a-carbinolamine dehydratase
MSKENEGIEQETVETAARLKPAQRPSRPAELKPERVQLTLKTMPGWRLSAKGNALRLTRSFPQAGEAAKLAAFVAALSAMGNHDLTLGVTAYKVTFRLQRANRRGIDRPLLDFARQIV